jgi:putative transposase
MAEIDRVFTKYPFSRQIAAYLPQSGFSAGRHRVRRLMNIMGLQAIYKGRTPAKAPIEELHLSIPAEEARNHATQSFGATSPTSPLKWLYLVAPDWATCKRFDLAASEYA